MMASSKSPYEPKGKCKKVVHRLATINKEISKINAQLGKTRENIIAVIDNTNETLTFLSEELTGLSKRCTDREKTRTMLKGAPKRIEFRFNDIRFYVDFTVVAPESDGLPNVKGSIIYGANRTLCFSNCIFQKNSINSEKCCRLARCDGLEDKPLVEFSLTQHGMIRSSELEDEWWIEDKSNLLDLHYRALDFIWKRALEWSNENILP